MSEAEPLRLAVVGTGAIAQIVHLPLLKGMSDVELVAVADRDERKAEAIAGRLGIERAHEDEEEVFAADDIDAVVICSPNHLHQGQAVGALEGGKHVLVERPLALDQKGAEAACRAAEKADRALMVALNNRWRPDVAGVKAFVESGELGSIFSMQGGWFNRKVRVKRPTWRHRQRTSGGGAFMDLGLQVLDLCLWMLDYPEVERLVAHMHPGEGVEVEDGATVLLWLDGGCAVSIDVTSSYLGERDRHYLRLLGTAGSARIQPLRVHKEMDQGTIDATPQIGPGTENPYTASYREELRQFIAAARAPEVAPPPREQVKLMRVVSMAYRSAEKGEEVRL